MLDAVRKLRATRWSVEYEYMFLEPNGKDLEVLSGYVGKGLLRPVVGTRVELKDIEMVRVVANMVYTGKGGLGKAVIEVR